VPGFPKKLLTTVLALAVCHVGIASSSAFRADVPGVFNKAVSEVESSLATFPTQDPVLDPWSQGLQEAHQLQTIGEYERAVQAYQALLDAAPEDSPERADASFLLGETQYLSANYTGAVDAFLSFAGHYPDDDRYGRAVFLAGRAYHALGSWSEAIAQYQNYLAIDETVASFVYEVMGDCYLAAHDYAAAAEAYRRGLDGPIDRLMTIHLLEGIAEAQTQSAEYDDLVATYDTTLEHAQGADYRAKTEYLAGQALAAAGNAGESHARYLRAVEDYPTAYHAYLSLIELVNAEYPVDEFQRGLVDYYNEAYSPAVEAFDRYIQNAPEAYSGEAHYFAALAHKEAGSHDLAIARLDELIENYPEGRQLGDAWIAKGQTLADMGDTDRAVELWAQFVALHPADPLAPEALWLSGELWEEQNRSKEAIYNYLEIQTHYPDFERAPEALHRAALLSFRAEAYESAIGAWQKLVDGYEASPLRPAAMYWLGRSFHATGDDESARGYLTQLGDAYPGEYYAVRGEEFAQTWSAKMFQTPTHRNMLLAPPTAEEQAEAENWLLSWSPVQPAEGDTVSQLPEALSQDGRLRGGLILWTLDLASDASIQIRSLKSDINDSPLDLYRLGLLLQQKGLYRLSVSCFDRLLSLAPIDKKASIPAFLLKLTHAYHFSDLLVAEAVGLDVDPLLLLALVRQESNFEWHVESWAGAQGLMQIMPATADWIALQLGSSDFSPSMIHRPYLNVRFGTWYFAHQLSSFNNDIVAALTAYNAGPGRVMRWQTPDLLEDDDLFLEYMPLEEPRLYVEKVYTHHDIYRRLYADQ
jgi:soluble lytic murein transglycosylase